MIPSSKCGLVLTLLLGTAVGAAEPVGIDAAEFSPDSLTFEQHVRPILKTACFQCHGEDEELRGGLDVRLVRLMEEGGDSGPAVVPGDLRASPIWQRIESDEMPAGEKKLSDDEKEIIRRWINQGARTARPEPEDVEDARFTLEELSHWSFQPVSASEVPLPDGGNLQTPIDAFIAEKLAEKELSFSPRADPHTLIRRATLDLTGLPPTPEEVDAFIKASIRSPQSAFGHLIDRLLDSPQFGVRWGRHWLDVAGFAESDGGLGSGHHRPHAWRYRDYVIESFNADKPIDQFFREQIAGDEIIGGEFDPYNPRHLELLTATGFLRMAPDATQVANTVADRNRAVADALQVVSSAMLGMTVGCAQCHDHKYEPIGIDDYYRFRAVFDPVFPLHDWQQPGARLIDLTTAEVRAKFDLIEAEAKVLEEDMAVRRQALGEKILEQKLADVPAEIREAARIAVHTPGKDRTPKQQAILDEYPAVKPVSTITGGLLIEYDGEAHKKFEAEKAKIAALRATRPPLRLVMATTERPGVVPESAVFNRGDPASPIRPVDPGELTVLVRAGRKVTLPDNDQARATTGRRIAYARQLTDGRHPLAARVFVNRVWQYHMGRGLVATPSDFGIAGARPSHPKLLDWLADDFVRHDWRQKRLHRLIMLSTTWQQQSLRTPELEAADPENRLWGRMNLRRMDAETIRDAILSVSGKLNNELGGNSVPVSKDGSGKAVTGQTAAAFRRSSFIEFRRMRPLEMLATFDLPDMNPNCVLRKPTTAVTQSLWFLNDEMIVARAADLAKLVVEETGGDPARCVQQLFVRLFAKPPTDGQRQASLEFITRQAALFRRDPDAQWQAVLQESPQAATHRAWASLCQTLLASNRFLYVD